MGKGIRLSKKYGVNPAIPVCFFCGKEKNQLILAGRLGVKDEEAPKHKVWDMEPCDECKKLMEMGIMLISIRDGETEPNPYRTGQMCVVKEEAAKRMFPNNGEVLKMRMAFVEDNVWNLIGLPVHKGGES